MENKFYAVAICKANYIHNSVLRAHKFTGAHIGLEVSDNIDKREFFEKPKVFNKKGSMLFTEAAIEGLVANIHTAHQKGWKDSAEHLRYIIKRLTDGFANASTVQEKTEDLEITDSLDEAVD